MLTSQSWEVTSPREDWNWTHLHSEPVMGISRALCSQSPSISFKLHCPALETVKPSLTEVSSLPGGSDALVPTGSTGFQTMRLLNLFIYLNLFYTVKNSLSPFNINLLLFYLKGRQKKTARFSLHEFTPQLPTTASGRSDQRQQLVTQCGTPTWVVGPRYLGCHLLHSTVCISRKLELEMRLWHNRLILPLQFCHFTWVLVWVPATPLPI